MALVHLCFLFLLSFHVFIKMSESLTTFVCQKCTKPIGFPSQRRLTKHLKEVHGPRLKCDYCDYEYPASRKDNLRRHIAIKHKSEESTHTACPSEEQSTDQKQTTESADTERPLDLSIQNKDNNNPDKGRQDRDSAKSKSTKESSSSQVPQTLLSDTRKVVAKAAPSSGCSTLSFSSTTPAKKITEHKSPSKTSAKPHRPNSPSKSSTSKAGKSTQHRSPSRKSSSPRRIITSSSHKTHTPSKSSKSKPPEKSSGDRSPSRKASPSRRAITVPKPPKSLSEKSSRHRSPSKKSSSLHTTKEPSSSQTEKPKGPHLETERAQKRKSSEKAETSEPKKSRLSTPDRVEKSSSTIQGAGRVRTLSESSTSSSSSSSSDSSSSNGSFSSANDPDIHFGTPPRALSPVVEPFQPLPPEEAEAPAADTFSIREHAEVEVPVTARSPVPTSPAASPKTVPDPTDESKEADQGQVSHQPDRPSRNPPSTSTSTAEERPQRPLSPSIAALSTEFLRLVDITSNFAREHRLLSPSSGSLVEEYVPPGLQPGGPTYVPTTIPTTPYLPQCLEVNRRTNYDAIAADPRLTFRGAPSSDQKSLDAGYLRDIRRRVITNGRRRLTVHFPSNCCMMKTEEAVLANGIKYKLTTSWVAEPSETVEMPESSSTE